MQTTLDVSDFMSGPDLRPALRVLVPLDGSEPAERALEMVRLLSPVARLEVVLFSVVDNREFDGFSEARIVEREEHLRLVYLEERGRAFGGAGIHCETATVRGLPAMAILKEATQRGVDLIIMSCRGVSGFARWRLGSVSDKVVRGADCDVLLIGSDAQLESIRSILLPLDGSVHAEQAIPVAVGLAARLTAAIHLVRVVKLPTVGVEATRFGYNTPEMIEASRVDAEEYIGRVGIEIGAKRALVMMGQPADALRTYAEAASIDLVVMTTHGRGRFMRAALGSVTDRLIGEPCPVWVVRPDSQGVRGTT